MFWAEKPDWGQRAKINTSQSFMMWTNELRKSSGNVHRSQSKRGTCAQVAKINSGCFPLEVGGVFQVWKLSFTVEISTSLSCLYLCTCVHIPECVCMHVCMCICERSHVCARGHTTPTHTHSASPQNPSTGLGLYVPALVSLSLCLQENIRLVPFSLAIPSC